MHVDLKIKIQNYLVMILIMIWFVEIIERLTEMTDESMRKYWEDRIRTELSYG